MFDLDMSKLLMVGFVALVVIGPKDLPVAMRAVGRVLAMLRRLKGDVKKSAEAIFADADLDAADKQIRDIGSTLWTNVALDPATAMRGRLPSPEPGSTPRQASDEAQKYASPEMQAYLEPLAETPALVESETSLPA
jgi:sec-independent protein translocase protein TatB